MTEIVRPGASILFMKVGTHAGEGLDDIVARKQREIEGAGFALWGYGGNTCHPVSMVQPFAESADKAHEPIFLCMEPMESNHFAVTARAADYSVDGLDWKTIPPAIEVIGSRYALAIEGLHEEEFELPLSHTQVALGNSMGRPGNQYIKGRVDKACLEVVDKPEDELEDSRSVKIGLVAKLRDPYAVFVRT